MLIPPVVWNVTVSVSSRTRIIQDTGVVTGIARRNGVATANSAAVAGELKEAELLAARNGLDATPAFLVGKRGEAFRPLQVQALTPEVFAAALEKAAG